MDGVTFDFSGLTPLQAGLLTFCGWTVGCGRVQPGKRTVAKLIARGLVVARERKERSGPWSFCWGASPHRVELHAGDCWTLFITGPRVREWGFFCMERGFIPWKRFTAADDPGSIGRGCDA